MNAGDRFKIHLADCRYGGRRVTNGILMDVVEIPSIVYPDGTCFYALYQPGTWEHRIERGHSTTATDLKYEKGRL